MATVTFDTLKFVDTLEQAQLPREQARAIAAAVRDAQDVADLVTKKDLEIALAPLRSELSLHRWMLSVVLGGVIVLILKAFF